MIGVLMAHRTRTEPTRRFRCTNGSVALRDNRCTRHSAIDDCPAETRIMPPD